MKLIMTYINILSEKLNYKHVALFFSLLLLPNLLGLINFFTLPYGLKLHFFQIAIFFAALTFGPLGGLLSGAVGSVYSAVVMHNPYIIILNMILGLLVGIFVKYGFNIVLSVFLAYLLQLPFLFLLDIYLAHLPLVAVSMIALSLLVSNLLWAIVVGLTKKYLLSRQAP